MFFTTFSAFFERALATETIGRLADQTRWRQRRGKIDPAEFQRGLMLGQLSAARLTLAAHIQSLSAPVSRQAVDQRFDERAVAFTQATFAHVLACALEFAPDQPQAVALRANFSAVYLLDSTSFDCPASLQTLFPSCGGHGSPANVKVLLRYDVLSGQLEPLHVLAGKRSDQGQAQGAAARLQPNQLQIQDKGFADSKAWQAATTQRAYLLTPWSQGTTLWERPAPDQPEVPVDVAAVLAATTANQVDWSALQAGKPGHRAGPLRLAAFRRPPASAARQRRGLCEMMRTQGRVPSAKALQLAGWLLLLTNAPVTQLPTAMLGYVYRLRWQVELIFRQLKSVLRLDQTESANPCRVQSELWARLGAAVLLFAWHAQVSAACWQRQQGEASFEKVIGCVRQWGQTLARAAWGEPHLLRQTLRSLWAHLLCNARKGRQKSRPTTWENLYNFWLNPRPATATTKAPTDPV